MNGIYLYLWLKETKDRLVNLQVEEISQRDRFIQVVGGEESIFISLYPEAPAVFFAKSMKNDFEKLKSFSVDLESARIVEVTQPNFMPILKLSLEKSGLAEKQNLEIIISLYRDAPNFSVRTEEGQRNLFARYLERQPKPSIFERSETDLVSLGHEKSVSDIEGVDKYLAQELNLENFRKLQATLKGAEAMPRLVSISPLRISLFAAEYIKEYPSFNELLKNGIKYFLEAKASTQVKARKNELVRNLKKRIEGLRKGLLNEAAIEQHRINGELLLANLKKVSRGAQHIKLFNPYTNNEVEVKLDPIKSAPGNAQAYFSKYKKFKRGQPKIKEKIKIIEKEIEKIMAMDTATMPVLRFPKPVINKEKTEPFRVFDLPSGSVVYVGKNAKSNAELTFRFAAPNDYFFHVRGYEGAHAILKATVPKGQNPKREDIQSAASIAAYFSKAKGQNNVPVSYTQRKYLKKNKKGKPGSVILMREQVVFAKPYLPDKIEEA